MAETTDQEIRGHFIICGLGHVGYRIAELLHTLGESFVVVTRDIRPEWRDNITVWAARFVEGDARAEHSLRLAGIDTARALLVVTDNDLVNTEIALDAQKMRPDLTVIVRIFDLYLAERIGMLHNVRSVLSPAMLTAPVFVAAALGDERLRTFEIDGCPLHVLRLPFRAGATGSGETIQEFCSRHNVLPLGLRRAVSAAPAGQDGAPLSVEQPLQEGDELIVAGSGPDAERLLDNNPMAGRSREPFVLLRRNNQPRGSTTTLRDVWRHTPPVLRHAFLTLLGFIVVSTIVLRFFLPGVNSWMDALYFVVTVMTTVGFGDYNFKDAPAWLKVYGCGMMISGALLVAVLYGIVTDYIVTLRVEQTLGRRPTRKTNHVVVIGLGDVGSRVAEMLWGMRIPVVAIERSPEHEALPALQDRIHIIVADANRESTLRQANIPQARAVVVTTTNDLDSLRIGHLAETMHPEIRSVVRIYDSALAHKLGDSLGLAQTVNAPATAAATFVASALQTGVEQSFTLGKRLLLLRWLDTQEVEAAGMVGRTGRELRAQGYAVLLRSWHEGERQQVHPLTPEDHVTLHDTLLVLEEYDPQERACRPPRFTLIPDDTTL